MLDLVLPEVNAFTVCEMLRRDPMTTSVPIVMITGLPGELPRLAGMELGADAYVSKPFRLQDIVASVRTLLERPRAGGGRASRERRLAA